MRRDFVSVVFQKRERKKEKWLASVWARADIKFKKFTLFKNKIMIMVNNWGEQPGRI
jgi:hypothetical protein